MVRFLFVLRPEIVPVTYPFVNKTYLCNSPVALLNSCVCVGEYVCENLVLHARVQQCCATRARASRGDVALHARVHQGEMVRCTRACRKESLTWEPNLHIGLLNLSRCRLLSFTCQLRPCCTIHRHAAHEMCVCVCTCMLASVRV